MINDLTKKLYASGYDREHHPDTVYWSDFHNFGFRWEVLLRFTWETACGLLIRGDSDTGRSLGSQDTSYMNTWYCPENDNPLLVCPTRQHDCPHVISGLPMPWCPCHRTQRPYNWGNSVEKILKGQAEKAHKSYIKITGGVYCACVKRGKGEHADEYEAHFQVEQCIACKCQNDFCVLRKQPRDLTPVNVFYDVRRTWITRQGFLEDKQVEVTKGMKQFRRPIARTDAEIWLQQRKASCEALMGKSIIHENAMSMEDSRQAFFSKMHRKYPGYDYFEFHYEVENIRISKTAQRDIAQDLQDVAAGIKVFHQADKLKAATEQKHARKEAALAARIRKAERMILRYGWDGLDNIWKNRAEKLLGDDRIEELDLQRMIQPNSSAEEGQLSLFDGETT